MRASVANTTVGLATIASLVFAPTLAQAHVAVSSGPGFANTTQEITFGVGHGCANSDTYRVTIDIPAGVTSVRAVAGSFGKATVVRDATQNVTSVTWQKTDADLIAADDNYYKLTLRLKVPNQPFTTLYFPTHQTCKNPSTGTETVVDWVATTQTDSHDAGAAMEPAPALLILPARKPGWNKVVVPQAMATLTPYFDDAQIVWKGSAAFSSNPVTAEQIKTTPGVTALSALAAGDEVWVKY